MTALSETGAVETRRNDRSRRVQLQLPRVRREREDVYRQIERARRLIIGGLNLVAIADDVAQNDAFVLDAPVLFPIEVAQEVHPRVPPRGRDHLEVRGQKAVPRTGIERSGERQVRARRRTRGKYVGYGLRHHVELRGKAELEVPDVAVEDAHEIGRGLRVQPALDVERRKRHRRGTVEVLLVVVDRVDDLPADRRGT